MLHVQSIVCHKVWKNIRRVRAPAFHVILFFISSVFECSRDYFYKAPFGHTHFSSVVVDFVIVVFFNSVTVFKLKFSTFLNVIRGSPVGFAISR